MKKLNKFISVLLSLALFFVLSGNVFADTVTDDEIYNSQIVSVTDEITEDTGEIHTETDEPQEAPDDTVISKSQAQGIISGAVYRIKNVGSGKYMNVHYGVDSDGTNIYQWTADGSTEQKFRVAYSSTTDSYMLYAMCSSTRVVSVARGSAGLANGQNIHLCTASDQTAQQMSIISLGSNQYRIGMAADNNLYLASRGNTNGSSGGTGAASAGNIYLSNYIGEFYQHWMFELLEAPPAAALPIGYLESVSVSSIVGWAYQSDIPNTPIEVHIYITHNSTGAQTVLSAFANIYRGDLAVAGYGDGCHGFSCNINWKTYKPGEYTIKAYALGVNSGIPQLTNVMTYTVRNIDGTVDVIESTYISGWAWKPDAPNESIDVHVYVYKSDGTVFNIYTVTANAYRGDLAAAGIGNGCHGFDVAMNFAVFPEEEFHIVLYGVDGSNHHTAIYQWYYNNRRPITLLGMIDPRMQYDFSTWMWSNDVVTYCQNIGCSQVNRFSCATELDYNYSYTRNIKESSYCSIFTHGTTDGESIEWSMYSIYHDPTPSQVSGSYSIYDLNELPNNYFSGTRCVVLMACCAGLGGASNPNNFVNTLQRKGVETVVGFKEEITFYHGKFTNIVDANLGAQLWAKQFTRLLGEGKTVAQAAQEATIITYNTQVTYELDVGVDDEDDYCGLDSYYIAGNANQVVKH